MNITNNTRIALLITMVVNAVIFGIGAVTVLSIPALSVDAKIWLPAVIVATFVVSPFVARALAPRLRSRRWHEEHDASRPRP